jgi:hypothetical protein
LGFYIQDNRVFVDHGIKDFGDTTDTHNPTSDVTPCTDYPMRVNSVFLRKHHRKDKAAGDNCPLIYALKKKRDLSVVYSGIKPLVHPLNSILSKFWTDCDQRGVSFDAVIPMPSSHKIAAILANRVALMRQVSVLADIFQKASSADIRAIIDGNQDIPREAILNIVRAINISNETGRSFSLSDVNTEYRRYIDPVKLQKLPAVNSILLVDDLFASGKTLIAAKNALFAANPSIKVIESLCLFSPLNGRIKKRFGR